VLYRALDFVTLARDAAWQAGRDALPAPDGRSSLCALWQTGAASGVQPAARLRGDVRQVGKGSVQAIDVDGAEDKNSPGRPSQSPWGNFILQFWFFVIL
jgi:hypothetical protein